MKRKTWVASDRAGVMEGKLTSISRNISEMESKIDYMENQARRTNLWIEGISESPNETWETTEKKMKAFISEKLKLPPPSLDRAHRVGKPTPCTFSSSNKPKTTVCKFSSYKEKEEIIRQARKLQDPQIVIYQDYSQCVQDKH